MRPFIACKYLNDAYSAQAAKALSRKLAGTVSTSRIIGILRIMKRLPPDSSVETVSVRITGRVQGVGFRAACLRQAHKTAITGWIRNAADLSVEALLQGPHDQVDRMLSWLLTGPPGARVDEVSSQVLITDRHFDRFEQW